jgi:GTP cyclohydrolase I
MGSRKERCMKIDLVRQLLREIENVPEEQPLREGLLDTPRRVVKVYDQMFSGYNERPEEILGTTFTEDNHQELVIVRDIEFFSHCEHHMVPFYGKAHIGYIPKKKLVGLSKLVRLTECFAHRLQIQERLTSEIADSIDSCLEPLGVMVVIEATHMCMKMRGVRNGCADTVTSAVRGIFRDASQARTEFLSLIRK